jgi:hypothetical protein
MYRHGPGVELEALLKSAREAGNMPRGTTNELNSKALLALNLRKLGDAHLSWAPRSYVVLPAGTEQGDCSEIEAFLHDFKASRAIAILQKVVATASARGNERSSPQSETLADPEPEPEPEPEAELQHGGLEVRGHDDTHRPERLWGREAPTITWEPRPQHPIAGDCVDVALSVVGQLSDADGELQEVTISNVEWVQLRGCRLDSSVAGDVTPAQCAAARAALSRLPPSAQLRLLRENVWLLKPSLNGGAHSFHEFV